MNFAGQNPKNLLYLRQNKEEIATKWLKIGEINKQFNKRGLKL